MFDYRTKLGDVAGSTFEFTCPDCQHKSSITATKLMMYRGGAARVMDVLKDIKCTQCDRRGAPDVELIE